MDKKIVVITAIFIFLITGYFSYSYFSTSEGLNLARKLKLPSYKYLPPSGGDQTGEFSGPKTEECPLNGEMLTKGHKALWEKRRPLGVMIENHLDSRPQSGITNADVIYEAVAEGGITRFLVMFYCQDAKYVGPVRSARIYFLELVQGYGQYPLYVHVGGANTPGPADALGTINKMGWAGFNDLNQFSVAFPTFYRDYERIKGAATEHTMYSSTARLWKYAAEKRELTNKDEDGVIWNKQFNSWRFKDDDPIDNPIESISFDFWEGKNDYSVKWVYQPKTNKYLRFQNSDQKHLDKNNGKQLNAKNIVIVFTKEATAKDGYPGGHMLYTTTGGGKILFFADGDVTEGTWNRAKKTSLIRFYDRTGKEISLNRGVTWIEILPIGNTVDY